MFEALAERFAAGNIPLPTSVEIFMREAAPKAPRSYFDENRSRAKTLGHVRHPGGECSHHHSLFRALGHSRYRRAHEPACSSGTFTQMLASCANEVLATDASPDAVNIARARLAGFPNVSVGLRDLRDGPPAGVFDLIVFSEVGHFFSRESLAAIVAALGRSLSPGGDFIAAHGLEYRTEHLLHGHEVHEVLAETLGARRTYSERREGFRIDRWTRT